MRANSALPWKLTVYRLFLIKRYILIALYPRYNAKKWAARTTLDSFGFLHPENDSTTKLFTEYLEKYNFESVFEIGGNCGGRLFELAARYPHKKFYCSDLNVKALEVGQQEATRRSIANIEYLHFDAQNHKDLVQCKELKNSDLVFSWATLIYIHPIYIYKLLNCIVTSNCKTLVLVEQDDSSLKWIFKRGKIIGKTNWLRDYEFLIKKICKKHNVSYEIFRTPCPSSMWNPGGMSGTILAFTFFN
jgi:SAM-dependent methyltransferase